jgi:hypothetical protein
MEGESFLETQSFNPLQKAASQHLDPAYVLAPAFQFTNSAAAE